MKMITNIEDYKQIKKAKKIIKDLESAIPVLYKHKKELDKFDKFIPVKSLALEVHNTIYLLESYYLKYKKILNKE